MKSQEGETTTSSEKETFLLARKLAERFSGDEVVLLTGDLGAGKTVFAKGIAAGLSLKDVNQVCSPSYTLVNIYESRFPIYHMDLYRLEKKEELDDLGWEDFLGQGVIVVEWAEKMDFPLEAIHVHILVTGEKTRVIRIKKSGSSR